MEFRLLGQLEARNDAGSVDLGPFRQRSVLALLLAHRGSVLSTDRILDSLWGESAAPSRQNALWVHISNLRSALEPDRARPSEGMFIRTVAPGYRLDTAGCVVDADRFEALVAEGKSLLDDAPEAASVVLHEALGLWRGRAFEEFQYEAFVEDPIRHLEELRTQAVEARIAADLARGLASELVGELKGLVGADPLREQHVAQLMTALFRSGRPAEAERAFAAYAQLLEEEVGVAPSDQLGGLRDKLLEEPRAGGPMVGRRQDPAGSTLAVRGYELREPLRETERYVEHAAYQPLVGREVAVQQVRAEYADAPAFIRRFTSDATKVAAIQHPHVLPLYDFWREPGAAYLVTPLVRGVTLATAVASSPLSDEAAKRLVAEIGGALGAAHQAGIGHGALGADCVYIEDDGRFLLGGFEVPGNDAGSDAVIEGDRRAFAQLIERVCGTRGDSQPAPMVSGSRNPYKGLRAFGQADAGDFFGRERLVERLLGRLGQQGRAGRFVALVGPSGSGKSSVIKAGLVPALRSGALAGSDHWYVAEMTPGRHPFEQLADCLESLARASSWALFRQIADTGFESVIDELLPDDGSRLALVIDQFEELYVQVDDDIGGRFVDELVSALRSNSGRLVVIATLRADFYDRPLQHRELGELFRRDTEVITPMSADELARAITEPARQAGTTLDPSLVGRLVAEVAGQPAALPLLQFTLTELFERQAGGRISSEVYDGMGGIEGALVTRAEQLHDLLGDEGRDIARQMLLRLVAVGRTATEDTRRRVLLHELEALGDPRLVASVLDGFGRHRLLTFDRDPVSRGPTVEIAHESLLREWDRLRDLIEENRSGLRLLRDASTAARAWSESNRDDSELYRGTRLQLTLGWIEESGVRLSEAEAEFLAASQRTETDALEIERRRVAQRDRQNRNLRRLLAAVAGIAAVAVILGIVALEQGQRANDARSVGETRRLAADAGSLVATNRQVALLLAAEAYRREPGPLTLGALQRTLVGADGLLGYLGAGREYRSALWTSDGARVVGVRTDALDVFDADSFDRLTEVALFDASVAAVGPGDLVAVVSGSREVRVIDLASGAELLSLPHPARVLSVEFSPDGTTLASGDVDGQLRMFDIDSGTPRWVVAAHPEAPSPEALSTFVAHEPTTFASGIQDIDFSADGMAVGTIGGAWIRTWSTEGGAPLLEVGVQRPSLGRLDQRIDGYPTEIELLDGGDEALVYVSRFVQRWDLVTGAVIEHQVVLSDAPSSVVTPNNVASAFGHDFAVVVELTHGAVVSLDDGSELQPRFDLQVDSARATAALSPDGRTLISAGSDGIVVWALDGRELLASAVAPAPQVGAALHASADGRFVALNTDANPTFTSTLWELGEGGAVRVPLDDPGGRTLLEVTGYVLIQDSGGALDLVATSSLDRPAGSLGRFNNYSQTLAPTGELLAIGGDSVIRLFDAATAEPIGEPLAAFEGLPAGAVISLSFNADGTRLAAATVEGSAVVLDTATWKSLGPPIASGAGQVVAVSYSPDGRWLATSSGEGSIVLRDAMSNQPDGQPLEGSTSGRRLSSNQPLAFSADGRFLVSTVDGVGRMWHIESRTQVGSPFVTSQGTTTAPTDPARFLPVHKGGRVILYELDTDSWFDVACRAAGRNLTRDEWEQFGPSDAPIQQTCPQWELGD